MSTTIINKNKKPENPAIPLYETKSNLITTFEKKAEEMKIFLKRNPIPKELLRK